MIRWAVNFLSTEVLSQVKLVVQSDVEETPVFKGDRSNKCSICEGVLIVEMHLVKNNTPIPQELYEVLARLMGKAKNAVKAKNAPMLGLHHNPSIDHIQTPKLFCDILKQHFS